MKTYVVIALITVLCIGFVAGRMTTPSDRTSTPTPSVTPVQPEQVSETPPQSATTSASIATSTVPMSPTTTSQLTPSTTPATPPTVTIKPTPTPSTPTPRGLQTMAWIYPSEPGCNAQNEYQDGRKIQVLKPEFFTVNGGTLTMFDASNSGCNGYTPTFVANLKKYSEAQYVTVSSASAADMDIFLANALSDSTDIDTLVSFVVDNDLTGIELDFEDFGGWNQNSYANFRMFVESLGSKLHSNNKKLMIDGPAIANQIEQGWFVWRYEDFINLPVDYIVIMAYDYQFDHGTGVPVAPLDWMREVITWISAKYPKAKLVVGIPSYGYEGALGKRPYIRTYDQLKSKPGFATATRDESSGEMTWQSGKQVYFYQDSESLRQKIAVVQELGITSISVWHLGGNQWY